MNRVHLIWFVLAFLASFGTAAARMNANLCTCDRMAFLPPNNPVGRVIGGQIVNGSYNGVLDLASAAVIYLANEVRRPTGGTALVVNIICSATSSNRTKCQMPFHKIILLII